MQTDLRAMFRPCRFPDIAEGKCDFVFMVLVIEVGCTGAAEA